MAFGMGPQQGHDYTDPDGYEVVDAWRCEESCPARKLGEMSGERPTGEIGSHYQRNSAKGWSGPFADDSDGPAARKFKAADKGTAARFYHQSGWEHERAEMRCARDPETGEPLCPVAKLDEQAGESKSSNRLRHNRSNEAEGNEHVAYGQFGSCITVGYDDSGGASRFYHNADWSHEIAERLATEAPVCYCPKAAKSERSKGLDDFYWRKDKQSPTGFVRISKDEWKALGEEEKRVKEETGKRVSLRARGNIHVAVKPISLCEWLASLLLPPAEYAPRRIVIPFCGTFSEGIGAMLAGWEKVVGVDFIQDHVDMAEARAAFWSAQPRQLELK